MLLKMEKRLPTLGKAAISVCIVKHLQMKLVRSGKRQTSKNGSSDKRHRLSGVYDQPGIEFILSYITRYIRTYFTWP